MRRFNWFITVGLMMLLCLVLIMNCAAEEITYAYPDADVSTAWIGSTGHAHWKMMNDSDPYANDGVNGYIYAYKLYGPPRSGGIGTDRYSMSDPFLFQLSVEADIMEVTEVKLWVRAKKTTTQSGMTGSIADPDNPGSWLTGSFSGIPIGSIGWSSITFSPTNDSWDMSSFDDGFDVKLTSSVGLGYIYAYETYAEISYGIRDELLPNEQIYKSIQTSPNPLSDVDEVLGDIDDDSGVIGGGSAIIGFQNSGMEWDEEDGYTYVATGVTIWYTGSQGALGGGWLCTNLDGATDHEDLDLTSTLEDHYIYYEAPVDGWSLEEIDDLEVEFGLNTNTTLREMWIEVDWIPVEIE